MRTRIFIIFILVAVTLAKTIKKKIPYRPPIFYLKVIKLSMAMLAKDATTL